MSMLSFIRARLTGIGALSALGVVALFIIACAASTLSPEAVGEETILDVHVVKEEALSRVVLVGLDHPVFTAFEQTDPPRVVVDLAQVRASEGLNEVGIQDPRVREVNFAPFSTGGGEPMMRVEVVLAESSAYEVRPGEEGLEIRVGEPVQAEAAAGAEDPWTPAEGQTAASEAAPDARASAEKSSAAPMSGEAAWESLGSGAANARPATRLVAVEPRLAPGALLVHLVADGSVDNAAAFAVENPDRLVMDLPSLVNGMKLTQIPVDSEVVTRIRLGQHEDHLRVVLDGGAGAHGFDGRRMVPVADGLLVSLGDPAAADALAADLAMRKFASSVVPEATAPTAEAPPEPMPNADAEPEVAESSHAEIEAATPAAPAQASAARAATTHVLAVEYDAQEKTDRVVVMGDGPLDYLVFEPDPETLVLSLQETALEPDAAVRLHTKPGAAISFISAFEQPDMKKPETRIVVRRSPGLRPEISRKGDLLLLDFARSGALAEASAAPAPGSDDHAAASSDAHASDPAARQAPAGDSQPPASLEPPAAIGILNEGGIYDGKTYTGRRISLDFKDVEIDDVLRLIAEVSDLNVIAGDEVKGKVTIRLLDVPWDQALDVILLTKNLGFVRVGNVLRIAPQDVIQQEEELRLQERRNREKLEDLVVKLQPVNYAAVTDVQKMVTKLLSSRGTVNIDKRTNTIILKDIPSVIDEATALIRAVDTQTPQVMIEAKIVEASLDFTREFGSVWSFGSQPLIDGFDNSSGPRRDLGGQDLRLHDDNNVQIGNSITAFPNALANLTAFIWDEKLNLDLQLQAAEVSGDGKVISSPRVVTLDNSKATIEQGVSIPFQTFENGDAQLEFVDAVLKLGVTPHITADKSIIMQIEVSRNAPDDSVFTLTGSPAIAKNQVKTETLVKDGQTLVLGGIYVVDKSNRQSRVPYLHQIPVLGAAFRSDEKSDARKELLIFVSPKVVQNLPQAN
jgi:type IV pilus assembly protein PilQ